MTNHWSWPILDFIINALIGAAILVAACALIYAAPIPMLATGQSCNKDERVTCPTDPCHDPPCWRDMIKPTAWGIEHEVCGNGTYYEFVDKETQTWRTLPVPPCTVVCDP